MTLCAEGFYRLYTVFKQQCHYQLALSITPIIISQLLCFVECTVRTLINLSKALVYQFRSNLKPESICSTVFLFV